MAVSMTNDEFIKKACSIHNNLYDYSHVNYSGINVKVKIGCSIHGIFEQSPKHHLNGSGCPMCTSNIKYTTESFVEKSKSIFGDIFDYSKTVYVKSHKPVVLICKIHGEFTVDASKHLRGVGCSKCKRVVVYQNIRSPYRYNFVDAAIGLYGNKYDYSLVNYINAKAKVKIRCIKHDYIFEQSPSNHLQGYGCPVCGGSLKNTKEKFIERSVDLNGNKYDYSLVNYINAKTKVKIRCIKHNYIFEQSPNKHISNLNGCPICRASKGELVIRKYLDSNKINYIIQKTFDGCIFRKPLKFDFYIPTYNVCIEFDGEQHYKPVSHFGGIHKFNNQVTKDKIKNEYCQNNNIHLLRISHNDNIEDILALYFKNLPVHHSGKLNTEE